MAAKFRFTGHGNGVEFGSSRLRGLVEEFGGQVQNQGGKLIANDSEANHLMQRDWRGDLHSRKARDVMHVMVSARAGTDVDQFRLAAREFLSKQFGGHRYVWAVHDPADDPRDAQDGGKRPHVHAHAMITMRSDYGDRARPTIETFRQWRHGMAEAARNNGIAMEMTDRRDLASAPAFTKSQVRPSYTRPRHEQSVSDKQAENSRTRHVGTSEAAQARYERKRFERPTYPTTDNSRDYVESARQRWQVMATTAVDVRVASFADKLNERLNMAQIGAHEGYATSNKSSGAASNPAGSTVVGLAEPRSAEEMTRPITREVFNAYEARATAELKRASETIGPEHRDAFDKTSKAVYRLIETRRAIVEMHEALEKGGVNAPSASVKDEPSTSTTPSAGSSVPLPSRPGNRGPTHDGGEVDEADVHATRAMAGRSSAQSSAPQTKTEASKLDNEAKAAADKSEATRNDNSKLAKASGQKTSRDKDDFEMG